MLLLMGERDDREHNLHMVFVLIVEKEAGVEAGTCVFSAMGHLAPGLLSMDGTHISQRGKQILAQEPAGLIKRALN